MNFVQDVGYKLELNLHSKIMLAFREGIPVDEGSIEGFFKKLHPKNSDNRLECDFVIDGQKMRVVVEGLVLITVLPSGNIFKRPDAVATANGFEFALAIIPTLYTMQEIVDWRDKYKKSNGGITKDDLRRESKKRAPSLPDPMTVLGLHDSFFDEVKELRQVAYVKSLELAIQEFSIDIHQNLDQKLEQTPSDRLRDLAKTDRTILYEETQIYAEEQQREYKEWFNSDENKREMQEEHDDFMRELLLEELTRGKSWQQQWDLYILSDKYQNLDEISKAQHKKNYNEFMQKNNPVWVRSIKEANRHSEKWDLYRQSSDYQELDSNTKERKDTLFQEELYEINPLGPLNLVKTELKWGIPDGGQNCKNYNGKTVCYHGDYTVSNVLINPSGDGWHEVHYENETQRFFTTTKYKDIAASYEVGQIGVWTISYENGGYLYKSI